MHAGGLRTTNPTEQVLHIELFSPHAASAAASSSTVCLVIGKWVEGGGKTLIVVRLCQPASRPALRVTCSRPRGNGDDTCTVRYLVGKNERHTGNISGRRRIRYPVGFTPVP